MSVALITGASSGIGMAFARALAQRQTDLVLLARRKERLQSLAMELRDRYSIRVEFLVQDLTAPDAVDCVERGIATLDLPIDLLVNNAGFGDYSPFEQGDRAKLLQMIQLNVMALTDLTYRFLPSMLARHSGGIINVGSTASYVPLPYMAVYSATKSFVLSFSEALWAETHDRGVKVLALCPGPTATDFFKIAGMPTDGDMVKPLSFATPEQVVEEALRAYDRGRAAIVAGGIGNQMLCAAPRFVPNEFLLKGVAGLFRPPEVSERT
ncbi:short-chain dehydrogenase [Rubidibacter lacunae KORDI 51-2]|uniref:Short-chain dehydrogenase n=1 Tax=Rubidibacter lacunae KORDI 51-2 TaxID=582515 RepID=U5DAU5_9CHRO|nr:SDR family oxidoreductase [Rubidibacter lacunae]ERN41668.1 short-chain dehydrogenase [Rubidibacter lacunae KORDI 51-2]